VFTVRVALPAFGIGHLGAASIRGCRVGAVVSGAMALKANPRESRQLALTGPMLLWRDGAGGRREGLLLNTDVCENLRCTERHLGVHALWVEEGLVSASLSRSAITTKSQPGSNEVARRAFFVSLALDDGSIEPQEKQHRADPEALAWFKAELDTELRAVLLARFEGDRRRIRERALPDLQARAHPTPRIAGPPTTRTMLPPPPSGPPAAPDGRPGRNDPCPCGSGLKYKRCCLDYVA
jgi:hypothetical protein